VAGTVEATATTLAPASGRACVAWQIALFSSVYDFGPVIVLDAVTIGFRVVPATGESVHAPQGRVRFAVPPTPLMVVRQDTFGQWLSTINDPRRPMSWLPYNEVRETILVPGERIELDGPFETSADRGESAYRDAPSTILVPRGVPYIFPAES
jgi:hypothetical protein